MATLTEPAHWQLGEINISARGSKSAYVQNEFKMPVLLNLTQPQESLTTPFGATTYGDDESTRKTIDFRLTPELKEYFARVDAWAVKYISEHSERLWKKKYTEAEIEGMYRPSVTQKGDYPPTVRCKINTAGARACRLWDSTRQPIADFPDLKSAELRPRVTIKSVYFMAKTCGLIIDVLDLMVKTQAPECPFGKSDDEEMD